MPAADSPTAPVDRARRDPSVRQARRGTLGLLTANVVSVAGGALSVVALPWFVLETTGSAVATGLAALCETLPIVVVSVFAGAIVDRLGAVATRVVSDAISAGTVLAVPALHATVGIELWQLLVLVAVNGAARAPAPAASVVVLNVLTVRAHSSADRDRSAYLASVRLATVLGVPVGGAVIAWRGAPTALVVDAATFAVSALVLVGTVRIPRHHSVELPSDAGRQRPWQGLTLLLQDRLARAMSLLLLLLAVLAGGWVSVLAPAFGQRELGSARELGLVLGASGVGALLGNLTYPWVVARVDRFVLACACCAAQVVLTYGGPALTTALPVLVPVLFVAGLGSGLLDPLWFGLLADRFPGRQQGHVFGVTFALGQAGHAAGAVLAGLVVAHLGTRGTLTGAAILGSGAVLAAAGSGALRDLRHRPAADHPHPSE